MTLCDVTDAALQQGERDVRGGAMFVEGTPPPSAHSIRILFFGLPHLRTPTGIGGQRPEGGGGQQDSLPVRFFRGSAPVTATRPSLLRAATPAIETRTTRVTGAGGASEIPGWNERFQGDERRKEPFSGPLSGEGRGGKERGKQQHSKH